MSRLFSIEEIGMLDMWEILHIKESFDSCMGIIDILGKKLCVETLASTDVLVPKKFHFDLSMPNVTLLWSGSNWKIGVELNPMGGEAVFWKMTVNTSDVDFDDCPVEAGNGWDRFIEKLRAEICRLGD